MNDERIKLTVAEKNGGAGHARNLSLEKASGRFITFLDTDDFWEPNFLEEMVSFMKKENAELAYSNYSRCDENLIPKIEDFKADKNAVSYTHLDVYKRQVLQWLAALDTEPVHGARAAQEPGRKR